MDRVQALAEQARRTLQAGNAQQALSIYYELAVIEPRSASWPREAAGCFKMLGDVHRYVEALHRAATLYVADGLGLKAIVALKAALAVAPDHKPTRDFLARLERASSDPRAQPKPAPVRGSPSIPPNAGVVSMFRSSAPPAHGRGSGVRELDLDWNAVDLKVDPATVGGSGSMRVIEFDSDGNADAPKGQAARGSDWPPAQGKTIPLAGKPIAIQGRPSEPPPFGAAIPLNQSFGGFGAPPPVAAVPPPMWPPAPVAAPQSATTAQGSPLDKFWELVRSSPTDTEAHRRFVAFAMQASHEDEALARYAAFRVQHPALADLVEAYELELRGLGPAGATTTNRRKDAGPQDWPPLPPGVQEFNGVKTPGQLPPIPLFSALGPDAFQAVLDRSRILELHQGDVLFRQGSRGTSLFVVIEGGVEIVREDPPRAVVSRIGEGEFFGEISLFTDKPRGATIQAGAERTQLLEITREVVEEIAAKHPEVLSVLMSFCRERMVNVLVRNHTLFQRFSPDDRMSLARRFRFIDITDNAKIIEEGLPSPGLFILVDGSLNVVRGTSSLVAILEPGALCGEISLVKKREATANVVASGNSMALFLPSEDFQTACMGHPELLRFATEVAEQRIKEMDDDLAGSLDLV